MMKTTILFGLKHKNLSKLGTVALFSVICLIMAGCASTTVIQSSPNGAKVYLDGKPVGLTPYTHTDKKIIGTTHLFKLEKDGFAPLYGSFTRNAEWNKKAVMAGCFSLIPFLWAKNYPIENTYDLRPIITILEPEKVTVDPLKAKTKAERMFELKQLLDAKSITEEEFKREKKKIMEE